ncbi:MAG: hypothetical protein HUJ93_08350, partial [Bacteroidales bacterium]|nr:hypothetical protein [Bacteroidales bacterium]
CRGEDAEAAKSLAENEEHQLIQKICDLQDEMTELQDDIQEMFYYDVDKHPAAVLETGVLAEVQTECSRFWADYEAAISDVESIAKELAAYSHYYTFPDMDFSRTRESFDILCGCGETNEGFINQCLKKLLDFDEAAALLILERNLDVKIIELQKAIDAYLKIPADDFDYSDMNRLEDSYRKLLNVGPKASEIETILEKSDKDFTEEDARIIAYYYIQAVKNKDASTVSLIVNGLTVEQYVRIDEDGKTEYTHIMWMDQYKSQMIAEQMLDKDGCNQKKTDEAYASFIDLKNTHYMLEGTTRPTSSIEIQTTEVGLLVLWDFNYNATNRKERVERMIFEPSLIQGTTDRERAESRYEILNKLSGHEALRMHCKVLKDESQLADYSGVKNKRDFKSNSAYDANYTCPSDTKSFFGTSEKRDFTYDFINSEDPKAYYLRVKGGRELNLTEEYESLLRMTEEEKKIYNYLHHTSKEEADRYLELLNQSLKTRLADEKFEKIKDHAVLETLSGYGAGVIQVTENIENRLGLNDDADGVPLVSENEVYSSMVQSDLADKGEGWEFAYGLTYGAGQATPGIVLTAATGGGAGSLLATTGLYSISAGGAARTEALRNGYT